MAEDLGIVATWNEAFAKARSLFQEQKIQAVATVSADEYKQGQYFSTSLSSQFQTLVDLARLSPLVYKSKEVDKFRLIIEKIKISSPEFPRGEDTDVLIIVYLKKEETVSVK